MFALRACSFWESVRNGSGSSRGFLTLFWSRVIFGIGSSSRARAPFCWMPEASAWTFDHLGEFAIEIVESCRIRPVRSHATVFQDDRYVSQFRIVDRRWAMRIMVFSPRRASMLVWTSVFGFGVEGAGSLVEDEEAGVLVEFAGDGDALSLAAGDVDTVVAEEGVVAVWNDFL